MNLAQVLLKVKWGDHAGALTRDLPGDLDSDGDVDIAEIMLAAVRWGETCED